VTFVTRHGHSFLYGTNDFRSDPLVEKRCVINLATHHRSYCKNNGSFCLWFVGHDWDL